MSTLLNKRGVVFSRPVEGSGEAKAGGVSPGFAMMAGAIILVSGGVAGWSLHGSGGPGDGSGSMAGVAGRGPEAASDRIERDRRIRLDRLDVDSLQAQVEQSQDSLATAQSQLAAAKVESAAAIASARARDDMARATLVRLTALYQRNACTPDELDNARMHAQVAAADVNTAQSKQLCLTTLEATIAQRKADVKVNQAKLMVAQTDLDFALGR